MKRFISASALIVACASFAHAQPAHVMTGMGGGDVSTDAMTAAGFIYDGAQQKYRIMRYVRGTGVSDTGAVIQGGSLRSSGDCNAISFDAYNDEGYGGFPTNKLLAHAWTPVLGSRNLGVQPNGSLCDYINASSDVSRNGRYVTGSGWTGGGCGPYRGWVYDLQTLSFTTLPASVSAPPINALALNTRADAINGDGTVVVGYDENFNDTFTAQVRRATVWTNTGGVWSEKILDPKGGTANGVNSLGTVIVGKMNSQTMFSTFGTSVTTPIKWTKSGTAWVPSNLGGTASMNAVFVSDDGNTVVGLDGGSIWIWRPDINGGSPVAMDTYLASVGALPPGMQTGTLLGTPLHGMNEDGSAIEMSWLDSRNPCLTTGCVGITYMNGTTCEPARVNFSPYNQSITTIPPFGIILNIFASGSWPLNYQWQKETSPGVWTDLADDNCGVYDPNLFDVKAPTTNQLRLGGLSGTWAGNYRCVVTNPCGSATSAVATIAPPAPPCYANCDGSTSNPALTANDFQCFLNSYAAGDSYANCDGSTFTPVLTANDFQCFLNAFAVGCT